MPKLSLPLYTSLVPNSRIDLQRTAIESWDRAGFLVTSLNSHRESTSVSEMFPNVTCATVMRDAQQYTGKPVVFINDILQYIRDADVKNGGIINSDIVITYGSTIAQLVTHLPQDTLLICPRTDVNDPDQEDGLLDSLGYDALLRGSLLKDWGETSFTLGMPFWDHWFPIMSLLSGRRVLKLISDEFRHVRHAVERDNSFFMYNSHFAEIMVSQMLDNRIGFGDEFNYSSYPALWEAARAAEKAAPNSSQVTPAFEDLAQFFDNLTRYVVRFIDARSEKIKI